MSVVEVCESFLTVEEVGDRIKENISNLRSLIDERESELNLQLQRFKVELGESSDGREIKFVWEAGELSEYINQLGRIELREKRVEVKESEIQDERTLEAETNESMTEKDAATHETEESIPKQEEYISMQPVKSKPALWKRTMSVPAILDEEANYQVMHPIDRTPGSDIDLDLYGYGAERVEDSMYDVIDESRLGDLSEYADYKRRVTQKLSAKKSGGKKAVPLMDLPVVATCTTGKKLGQLNKPKGVALSGKGDIFVAEKGNNRVQVFNSVGNKLYTFGAGRMSAPYGVLVLGDFAYVTLSNMHMLQMYTVEGDFVKQKGKEGKEEGKLKHPTGIDGDEVRGKLFVCDTDNNRVQIFDNNLRFLKVLKTVKLDRPLEVKVIKFGAIVVLDRSRECVHFISSTGELIREIVDTERYPMVLNPLYIALSPDGNLLLSDFSNHCIHVFSEEGKPLWKIGQEGKGKPFEEPRGIACDDKGRLVTVCNKSKNMLQIFEI